MAELLLGCGHNHDKRINSGELPKDWVQLTTCDIDPDCKPDIVHDLNKTPWPWPDNSFDEIHAYEVLEHLGRQGDYRAFFEHFYECWRILKPDGFLCFSTPMWDSPWAWSDPGHTRIVSRESVIFLDRLEYRQVGKTSLTDYRKDWRGDFELVAYHEMEHSIGAVLQAHKPIRE